MKLIPLTKGKMFAQVDDEDFELVNQYKWSFVKDCNVYYATTTVKKEGGFETTIRMHRLIKGVTKKAIKVDHADHNGLNNQKYNLRECTNSQNGMNRVSSKNSTSKYLGVFWRKQGSKWHAQIKAGGIYLHLGLHTVEEQAAIAYNNAARKYFGEFANLNIITDNNVVPTHLIHS